MKAKKTPHSKPKTFNVKEKLQLSWCQRNHGKSYWSGTNCLTFKRTNWLNHGGKREPEQMPSKKPTHLFDGTKKKANAMKIEVHHAGAVRNESHSEEELELSQCQYNHGSSNWDGKKCIIFKRTLCLIHGGNGQPEQMPSRKPTFLFDGTKID